MSVLTRLTCTAYGTHFADQIALVLVPLTAALAFDVPPLIIGLLVACQSMAHLLGSIPFGILVDQRQPRLLAKASALMSLCGFGLAAFSTFTGTLALFAFAITCAGFGVVLFGLTALSSLPRSVPPRDLAKANAAIEVPRALSSFAVPLAVGLTVGLVPIWTLFAIACAGSAFALSHAYRLPNFDVAPKQSEPALSRIVTGGRYVLRHRLLLPISLCAVFWNYGFAALLVVLVPAIQTLFAFHPGSFGIALAAFGLAALCGTLLAGHIAHLVEPSTLLIFGPGSSALATVGLLAIGPETATLWLYGCFFLLGVGPAMWLITQNAVRQMVTPADMLGRVNAVIQTTIYGIRPLGAVAGGAVAGMAGAQTGRYLVVLAFACSAAVPLLSDLRKVRRYDTLSPTAA